MQSINVKTIIKEKKNIPININELLGIFHAYINPRFLTIDFDTDLCIKIRGDYRIKYQKQKKFSLIHDQKQIFFRLENDDNYEISFKGGETELIFPKNTKFCIDKIENFNFDLFSCTHIQHV